MVISFGRTGFTNNLGPLDAPLLFCSRSSHEVTGLFFRFGGSMGVEPRELSVLLLKPSEDVALDDIFSFYLLTFTLLGGLGLTQGNQHASENTYG